ncbi:hypothetical protein ABZ901_17505 [Actinacidiphila alni]|uniref:hypothetical protein n=1 Tax=Actinacidiphila alni TaxID=380248 RepID=UPI0033D26527
MEMGVDGSGMLTVEEAFRAAFRMVEQYVDLEERPDESLVLLLQYMESDPARWTDWLEAVRWGLANADAVDPYA